jgi:hypothetical protein
MLRPSIIISGLRRCMASSAPIMPCMPCSPSSSSLLSSLSPTAMTKRLFSTTPPSSSSTSSTPTGDANMAAPQSIEEKLVYEGPLGKKLQRIRRVSISSTIFTFFGLVSSSLNHRSLNSTTLLTLLYKYSLLVASPLTPFAPSKLLS